MAVVGREFDFIKTRQQHKIPGYAGHCPGLIYVNGITFGNATKKRFFLEEKEKAGTSKADSLYRRSNTYKAPEAVTLYHIKKQTAPRPKSAQIPAIELPYTLSHTGKRRDEVLNFHEVSQLHRTHYQDLTGKIQKIPNFAHRRVASAPVMRSVATPPTGQETQDSSETSSQAETPVKYLKYSVIPFKKLRHPQFTHRQPSAREKKIRDVFFERR